MKNAIIVCFLIVSTCLFAQSKDKILGKWQAESSSLTSMNFDTYEFFRNGNFNFKPNGYNGLNRIISINGIYKLHGDTLFLTPTFTNEIFGGNLIRSESTTLSDTWEIVDGVKRKILCNKKRKQSSIIKFNSDKSILIDGREFFRIE